MEIDFASKKLAKLCNSRKTMRAKLGPRDAERLAQRMNELKAVQTLEGKPVVRCEGNPAVSDDRGLYSSSTVF